VTDEVLFYHCIPFDPLFFCEQLWKRFRVEEKPPAHLGASRYYNVDMVPKV
jgi:hypothetical protein